METERVLRCPSRRECPGLVLLDELEELPVGQADVLQLAVAKTKQDVSQLLAVDSLVRVELEASERRQLLQSLREMLRVTLDFRGSHLEDSETREVLKCAEEWLWQHCVRTALLADKNDVQRGDVAED